MLNLNGGLKPLALGSVLTMALAAVASPSQKNSPTDPSLRKAMLRHEARFYPNKGQWNRRGQFLTRRPGMDVWFDDRGIDFDYYQPGGTHAHPTRKGQVVSMQFVGAGSKVQFDGISPTKSRQDYLLGKKWVRGVKGYGEVNSPNVFPGVAFRGYYDGDQPRYDFIVAPNADASSIKMRFKGADSVAVTTKGVELGTQIGKRVQGDLHVYQVANGKQVTIPASFKLIAKNEVQLKVGAYDHSKKLIVDPLVYGTYFGANGGWDEVHSVVANTTNSGGVYMTGDTQATLFPVTIGPYFLNLQGIQNAFIASLQGDAFDEDYSAFIGGSNVDTGTYIKLDPHGNLLVAGTSTSGDFASQGSFGTGNNQDTQTAIQGDASNFTVPIDFGQFALYSGNPNNSSATAISAGESLYVQGAPHTIANLDPQVSAALGTLADPATGASLLSEIDSSNPPISSGFLNNGAAWAFYFPKTFTSGIGVISTRFFNQFAGQDGHSFTGKIPQLGSTSETSEGLPHTVVNYFNGTPTGPDNTQFITPEGSSIAQLPFPVTGGTFTLTLTVTSSTGGVTVDTSPAIPANATAGAIQTAIGGLGISPSTVVVTDTGQTYDGRPPSGTVATDIMEVQFVPGTGTNPTIGALVVDPTNIEPSLNLPAPINPPHYTGSIVPFIWCMAFSASPTTLSPIPNSEISISSPFGMLFDGFDVKQVANPAPTLPDDIVFSGTTSFAVDDNNSLVENLIPYTNLDQSKAKDGVSKGVMLRYNLTLPSPGVSAKYALNKNASAYIGGGVPVNNRGIALDGSGNAYLVGTVSGQGNTDTSTAAGQQTFVTTPTFGAVAQGGQLLRNKDVYVQKFMVGTSTNPASKGLFNSQTGAGGALIWSGFLGGHADDVAGGWVYDLDGSIVATGSAVAVDSAGSVYVISNAHSFDFPRTRGVYDENFQDSNEVAVTKITNDGSSVLYSTGLNTSGDFHFGAGIAVNELGEAVVTGNMFPDITFPENVPSTPPNPDQPTAVNYGTIGTTSDAFAATYAGPAAPQAGTFGSWVNIISSDATSLIYGSWLGGSLDNRVYGPYVDSFGDTWLFGWIETYRTYILPGMTTPYENFAALPASMISSDAFKNSPDGNPFAATLEPNIPFGFFDPGGVSSAPEFVGNIGDIGLSWGEIATLRDGWVVKLRVGLPSVQSLTFSPATVPGGFGTSSTGTVILSQAAPSGGAQINLSVVSGTGASFSSSSIVGTSSITIPAGSTTGTFTIYSEPVGAVTPVTVQANYLGSFQDAALSVEPYLAGLSLSPTTVVGGNITTATISLVQPAPSTTGLTVTLSSPSGIISFPNGNSVTVPPGQTTATIAIAAEGVIKTTTVSVAASIQSYSVTQSLVVTPAQLASLVFSPSTVSDGTQTKGTITLNGAACGPFGTSLKVVLSGVGGGVFPGGETVNGSTGPVTVSIPSAGTTIGDTTYVFTLNIPLSSQSSTSTQTIQATMGSSQVGNSSYPASTVTGSITEVPNGLASFTLTPTTISAGGVAVGTVTLVNPAPASGVTVNIIPNQPNLVLFEQTGSTTTSTSLVLTIPSGSTSATFNVIGDYLTAQKTLAIYAARPNQAQASWLRQLITVTAPQAYISLSQGEVVGGNSTTGTIVLTTPAPTAQTFTLKTVTADPTNSPALSLPTTVMVAAGQTMSKPFTIGTSSVTTQAQYEILYVDGTIAASTNSTINGDSPLLVDVVSIASITFTPDTLIGGQTTQCTITLGGPAPSAGIGIDLSLTDASQVSYFKIPLPTKTQPYSVKVAGGKTSVTFSIPSTRVSRNVSVTVNASTVTSNSSDSTSTSGTVFILR